jgi:outer membrane protein W
MTKKITNRTLLIATVAAFGFAVASFAQGNPTAGSAAGTGLLGQSYAGVNYGYTFLHDTPVSDVQAVGLEYNQPLNTGFDFNLGLSNAWSSRFSNTRAKQQDIDASAVAFIPDLTWGRPFVGVGAGWVWTKTGSLKDNSLVVNLDTGVEFQVTREFSLTPLVAFTDATSFHTDNKWNYGVKANYWVTREWSLTASVLRNNRIDTTCSLGLNYRF